MTEINYKRSDDKIEYITVHSVEVTNGRSSSNVANIVKVLTRNLALKILFQKYHPMAALLQISILLFSSSNGCFNFEDCFGVSGTQFTASVKDKGEHVRDPCSKSMVLKCAVWPIGDRLDYDYTYQ